MYSEMLFQRMTKNIGDLILSVFKRLVNRITINDQLWS